MSNLKFEKIIQNKHAYYDYFIEKKLESGVSLLGWEVKCARSKTITINNSFVSFRKGEAFIYNSIFQSNTLKITSEINTTRARKLLLNKYELLFLIEKVNQRNYTVVVLDLFWKNSWIKANIGLAKGKKKYDKRNNITIRKWRIEKNQITKKYINK